MMQEENAGEGIDSTVTPESPLGLRLLAILVVVAATVGLLRALLTEGGWAESWGWSPPAAVTVTVAVVGGVAAAWICMYLLFCVGRSRRAIVDMRHHPAPPEAYAAEGLGPLPADADGRQLYIDMVKRTVTNIPYEDVPLFFYDHKTDPKLARAFSLARRVRGEDGPTAAHTMIGVRRLENLQQCIESILREDVPGDLVETGSYLGGATIFMRAVLKAYGVTDRRVIACDTFKPPVPRKTPLVLRPILAALASIPSQSWQRRFYMFLQSLPDQCQAFPPCENPSQGWVEFVMWGLRNPVVLRSGSHNSLELVKSHFARYGLLDDQTVLLQGFFSDTLPAAPLDQLAMIRLDGDTYESTMDAIKPLYPKLSPGGYCIVDDYGSFPDCRRAIHEYREEHSINDDIVPIDNLAVFWQKGS